MLINREWGRSDITDDKIIVLFDKEPLFRIVNNKYIQLKLGDNMKRKWKLILALISLLAVATGVYAAGGGGKQSIGTYGISPKSWVLLIEEINLIESIDSPDKNKLISSIGSLKVSAPKSLDTHIFEKKILGNITNRKHTDFINSLYLKSENANTYRIKEKVLPEAEEKILKLLKAAKYKPLIESYLSKEMFEAKLNRSFDFKSLEKKLSDKVLAHDLTKLKDSQAKNQALSEKIKALQIKEVEKSAAGKSHRQINKVKALILYHSNYYKEFPRPLDSYAWEMGKDIKTVLLKRIERQPFYLVATIIFLCSILHTFFTSGFMSVAHKWEHRHEERKKIGEVPKGSVHVGAEIFHFLGEVEAVFGIWAVALGIAIGVYFDWSMVIGYLGGTVNYTEPMFVVIIMTLAATRPILKLSEAMMEKVANLMGGTLTAWWFSILTIGPVLGSFITEPAAMTISALLLGKKLYELEPKESFKYATIGLLFVNVSVGGTLSHFAAPPVLMVAAKFDWGFGFMITNFGWKAIAGIVMSNLLYFMFFRSELNRLQEKYAFTQLKKAIQDKYVSRKELEDEFDKTELIVNEELGFAKSFEGKCVEIKNKIKPAILEKAKQDEDVDQTHVGEAFDQMFEDVRLKEMKKTLPGLLDKSERPPYRDPDWDNREDKVPSWIIIIHLIFMGWTVYNAHYPVLFVGGFLFFLGFAQATSPYQNRTDLKPALLVGFFLAGLVIHGGMQGWWIAPVLSSLTEVPLMIGSTILTAFNDNAAITFLSSLVPAILSNEGLQYAVVAGAVTGGGLTVIANAPNPAGQAILKKYFENGVSPAGLAKAALIPTIIMGLCYMLFR